MNDLLKQLKAIDRDTLTAGQQRALAGFKSMIRNISEEHSKLGGMTHVSPAGIEQARQFVAKHGN